MNHTERTYSEIMHEIHELEKKRQDLRNQLATVDNALNGKAFLAAECLAALNRENAR